MTLILLINDLKIPYFLNYLDLTYLLILRILYVVQELKRTRGIEVYPKETHEVKGRCMVSTRTGHSK